MSDSITGVKVTTPAYPVRPAQPADREDRSGKRQPDTQDKRRSGNTPQKEHDSNDEENRPTIDEYI